jgi:multiple sugar transport system permease protein
MLVKKYVSAGNTQDYGKAAAYSVMLFFITLVISFLFYRLTSDKTNDGR